jgi:hypothetical protein
MEDFLVVEVCVRFGDRKVNAQGLWHVPRRMTDRQMRDWVDLVLAAMNGWFARQLPNFPPGCQCGHKYTPMQLSGRLCEQAVLESSQFPLDSVERFVDRRIILGQYRGNRRG